MATAAETTMVRPTELHTKAAVAVGTTSMAATSSVPMARKLATTAKATAVWRARSSTHLR